MTIIDAKELIGWLATWYAGVTLVLWVITYTFSIGIDDSDSGRQRSGMIVSVDAATKCEYLMNPKGGIIPRMDAQGQHRGCIRN